MDLLSCELDRDAQAVVARWRMGCGPAPPRPLAVLQREVSSRRFHPVPPHDVPAPPFYPPFYPPHRTLSTHLPSGDLALLWRPRVELTGCTRFFFDPARGGRVVRYRETWDISAGEALMQIVTPGRHKGPPAAAVTTTTGAAGAEGAGRSGGA